MRGYNDSGALCYILPSRGFLMCAAVIVDVLGCESCDRAISNNRRTIGHHFCDRLHLRHGTLPPTPVNAGSQRGAFALLIVHNLLDFRIRHVIIHVDHM